MRRLIAVGFMAVFAFLGCGVLFLAWVVATCRVDEMSAAQVFIAAMGGFQLHGLLVGLIGVLMWVIGACMLDIFWNE